MPHAGCLDHTRLLSQHVPGVGGRAGSGSVLLLWGLPQGSSSVRAPPMSALIHFAQDDVLEVTWHQAGASQAWAFDQVSVSFSVRALPTRSALEAFIPQAAACLEHDVLFSFWFPRAEGEALKQ